jgi:hypothetical protein
MSKFMILGTDERDVEEQLSLWLKDKRGIKINRVNPPQHERPTLLTRLGGKNVPHVSMLIDYELSEAVEK